MVREILTVAPRFCGPPDVGNGGYVAGRLAAHVPGPCEVSLRAATPLGRPLEIRLLDDGAVALHDEATELARARPVSLEIEPPKPPAWDDALHRAGSCRAFETHPFPRCFVCGPAREPGDGLRVLPGWFAERGLAAAPWIPDASLAGADGRVRPEFVWAALDSPSAFPLLEAPEARRLEPMVLGRLAADVRSTPRPGERCVVVAWTLDLAGKRGFAGSALWSEDGLCACARATWVSLA